jgi:hypothetical protein
MEQTRAREEAGKESFHVRGPQLLDRVQELLHEGNVRRIVVKHGRHTVAEFPLTVGVVGTVFAPILAAAGALAAVLSECTIEVERAGRRAAATPAATRPKAAARRRPTRLAKKPAPVAAKTPPPGRQKTAVA